MTQDRRVCTGCGCSLQSCLDYKRDEPRAIACCPDCSHPEAKAVCQEIRQDGLHCWENLPCRVHVPGGSRTKP